MIWKKKLNDQQSFFAIFAPRGKLNYEIWRTKFWARCYTTRWRGTKSRCLGPPWQRNFSIKWTRLADFVNPHQVCCFFSSPNQTKLSVYTWPILSILFDDYKMWAAVQTCIGALLSFKKCKAEGGARDMSLLYGSITNPSCGQG